MALDDAPASPAVVALRKSLADLVEESQALRTDVREAEAARKRVSHINLALLGLLGALIVSLLVIGWQNNRLAYEVKRANGTLADCTVPGGQCYNESLARTGLAIQDLIRGEQYVAECARLYPGESGPEFDRKLEACVAERLRKARETPSPAPSVTPQR